jgi:hypothetical protein
MATQRRSRFLKDLPELPLLGPREELLLDSPARRLPLRAERKRDYGAFGRLALTNKRLVYASAYTPRENLGDVEIRWEDVAQAKLVRGFWKFWMAQRPYVFLIFLGRPMFAIRMRDSSAFAIQVLEHKAWNAAIQQLRILHPALDPLAGW